MPAPKFHTLKEIKQNTVITFIIYRAVGLKRIEHIENCDTMAKAINRVLKLNSGCRKPKYFYTREIRRNESLFNS